MVFLAKRSTTQQLLRAAVCVATLSYVLIAAAAPQSPLSMQPLIGLSAVLLTDLTPFVTAILLMLNVGTRLHADYGNVMVWYYVMQVLTVAIGGAYEVLILSDYGFKSADNHGRSFLFWKGLPLKEDSFRKGVTKSGRLLRRFRNLMCLLCAIFVFIVDPILSLVFGTNMFSSLFQCTMLFTSSFLYMAVLMYEETLQPIQSSTPS